MKRLNKKQILIIIIVFFLLAISPFANPKPEIYEADPVWETLKHVTISNIFNSKTLKFEPKVTFSDSVVQLNNKNITIKGFKAIDHHKADAFILTSHPDDVCAFCGEGGIHTIMKLNFSNKDSIEFRELAERTYLELNGTLSLNNDKSDFIYLLKNTKIVKIIE